MEIVVVANLYVSISRTERRVLGVEFLILFLVCIMLFLYVSLLAMHSYSFDLGFGDCRTFLFLGDNLKVFIVRIQSFLPRRRQSCRSLQNQVFPSQEDSNRVDLLK